MSDWMSETTEPHFRQSAPPTFGERRCETVTTIDMISSGHGTSAGERRPATDRRGARANRSERGSN